MTPAEEATQGAQRRRNLLTGDDVLVSPQRLIRPWQGSVEGGAPGAPGPSYDPQCYLCPGNARAGGVRNPPYKGVYLFDNDFPALATSPADPTGGQDQGGGADEEEMLRAVPETGRCRVICYTPDHSLTMAGMSEEAIFAVVCAWGEETTRLAADRTLAAATIFENRGAMMGASNPHPHGQIWATSSVPNELRKENERQKLWLARRGETLLSAYLARELEARTRLVVENDAFAALVPFWAAWPFETLILPKAPLARLDHADEAARRGLAQILKAITSAYDRVFNVPFPYSMGVHQAPFGEGAAAHFSLHVHFYPPLLRSASVRKFMVGFEMLGSPQRDLTPEAAAERLRAAARG
jgi:UDPglucose--hexose-1-phosphate uridylyltransferase